MTLSADAKTGMLLSTALISVDIAAFVLRDNKLQVLTHSRPDTNLPALPAGRIEPELDSCLDNTAERHLLTLLDTPPTYLEQVVTIGNDYRDTRGWSLTVVYYALIPPSAELKPGTDAEWHDVSAMGETSTLAFDHGALVKQAMERLSKKVQYSTLPLYLLPETFSLSDIRKVFEALLGKAPPMRSIRNRFLSDNLLQPTGTMRYGSNRPAALYRINPAHEPRLFNRLYHTTAS
ncbi:NUDIX hydrolase [Endozoicomonadaceae bacterium StTr2]